jgi:hypothetical protein
VETGGLGLLDLLHFMGLVIPAEWAVGFEFYWHFHDIFLMLPDSGYHYYLNRLLYKTVGISSSLAGRGRTFPLQRKD